MRIEGGGSDINDEIRSFVLRENYPCVAAIQSVVRNDYLVGTYGQFGTGVQWHQLRIDLLHFLALPGFAWVT